jgi:hypothetical protein
MAVSALVFDMELAGAHVIASVRDYEELMKNNFLESLHA